MALSFLAFGYKLSNESATARVAVWRALKELGAAPFQQGMSLLPERDGALARLEELKAMVEAAKGSVNMARLSFVHPADEEAFVETFKRLRDEEYSELEENCERMIYELDRETEKGRFAFSELEEGEDEGAKLKRWAAKIEARDFFRADGKVAAEAALEKAKTRLRKYSLEVYRHENKTESQGGLKPWEVRLISKGSTRGRRQ